MEIQKTTLLSLPLLITTYTGCIDTHNLTIYVPFISTDTGDSWQWGEST